MEVAGILLGPIIEVLLDKLVSRTVANHARRQGIDRQLKKLEKMLPDIRSVLADAEEKQTTNDRVKSWMEDLSDLAYDLDDLLDDLHTEALRLELIMPESQASSSTSSTSKVRKLLIPTCCTTFTSSSTPPSSVKLDHNMMSKVEEITTRLEDIEDRKNSLDLKENVGGIKSNKVRERWETTSLVKISDVYGREGDKMAIIELLLRDEAHVSVIPIVGMGGIGKTTLAQLVYDDKLIEGRFHPKAWVCVSDDFDVVRVTKTLLTQVTSQTRNFEDLDSLQCTLKENLLGKKFLLVLDDVWNEKYEDWELLQRPFMFGAPGSKIIITTRHGAVASTMSLSPTYSLNGLSKDDCLSLFAYHALGRANFDAHPRLKGVGEQIVLKCKGLPLAAKTLGGLLRNKPLQRDWENILNSKIWDLPEQKSGILPALRLSYHHLPSHLKQCFAYCAIFPKDYEFDKDELVLLWMGVGLLQLSKEKKCMEDFGDECFDDLLSRSFFQQSGGRKSRFVMHDLLNDLALHVVGDICFRLEKVEGDMQFEIPKRARHLSYIRQLYEVLQNFRPLCKAQHLRTFLPLSGQYRQCYLANKVLLDLLTKLQCLRVLYLSNYAITKLPNSIGDLKHLRYLNLSWTLIRQLPESVSTLYNLQTLLLRGCRDLCMLPPNIGNLINLHHLDITNTPQLQEISSGIGKLTNLQTLSKFVVGENNEPGLKELRNLRLLRRSISITKLQNVMDVQDANEANLKAKQYIEELELAWDSEFNDVQKENLVLDVLDKLQPHKNIKGLTIKFYRGINFPSWIGHSSFSEMMKLTLLGCRKCRSLPPLGQLPMLKELRIEGMHEVQTLGVDFGHPFPSLERLIFEDMPSWKEWSCSIGVEEGARQFPCLRELTICGCPNLIQVSLLRLPSLQKLELEQCHELALKGIVDLTSLISLTAKNIIGLSRLDEALLQSLVALESLVFRECNQLMALWKNGGRVTHRNNLVRLQRLSISSCPQLVSLGEELDDEELPCINLEELDIEDCVNLEKLPNDLNKLSSLTSLKIKGCSKLVCFPKAGVPPILKELRIEKCNALKSLPDGISGLEKLEIEGCSSLTSWPTITLPTALKRLHIRECMNLDYFGKVSETTMVQQQQEEDYYNNININMSSSIEELSIYNWAKVGMLLLDVGGCVKNKNNNFASLLELEIYNCDVVESLSFPERALPNLKYLDIDGCVNLRSLAATTNNILQSLEDLFIWNCPCLESMPERGGRLSTPNLRWLGIKDCSNLRCLPFFDQNLQSLESIGIEGCPCLESIPESGVCLSTPNLRRLYIINCSNLRWLPFFDQNLQSLESIKIDGCPCLESIPESGVCLSTPNLRRLYIINCSNLRWLPFFDQNLQSLESIKIDGCRCLESFPQGNLNLAPNLIELTIRTRGQVLKPLAEWGLHRLTSLQKFRIKGGYPELVSFPFPEEDDKSRPLPASLTTLWIEDLPNLESISSSSSKGSGGSLQNLTSLRHLSISDCPKLRSLPKEGLPSTLQSLHLIQCPLLEERCLEDQGDYWPNIAHIPDVYTDTSHIKT
ncbi:putative disease resistance RPP13-like protein 1 isoform X2 [Cornus florida]|uniref:putative disease resistance RPP13-like protein 1 isoform X2 n=1 Tax=Cornus florida TaxID=4283 RepID=UPI0028972B54|nr:putative disease resistance RPP13-like protein 1 isoform X2 [Cornus florida]